jgi:N-acetylneuraminic acid mutarotase
LPTARASSAAAIIGNKIVVIGGVGEGQNPVNAVEMFDIKTKKWEKMEPLTEALLGRDRFPHLVTSTNDVQIVAI